MAKRQVRVSENTALREFVSSVNAAGGVVEVKDGFFAPATDPEWTDLGSSYMLACEALGVRPRIAR